MGLLQREIEKAGISTVSISNVPEITERVCVPRAVFVQYPFGRLLGRVGDRSGQGRICDDMLQTLVLAQGPNHYRHLPYVWPEPPEETRWRPDEPPPLGKYAQEKSINLPRTLLKAMQDAETKGKDPPPPPFPM